MMTYKARRKRLGWTLETAAIQAGMTPLSVKFFEDGNIHFANGKDLSAPLDSALFAAEFELLKTLMQERNEHFKRILESRKDGRSRDVREAPLGPLAQTAQ